MSGKSDDDAEARAERARKNLKRLAKAVEFEAFEEAELRREERKDKIAPESSKAQTRPASPDSGLSAGRRKGIPSQRGK